MCVHVCGGRQCNVVGMCVQVHEACLLVSSVLVEGIKEREVEFEVLNFVEQVVLPGIRANGECATVRVQTW